MAIVITTLSIFIITGVVWVLNKALPFKVCPICAGVSGTWLWILIGMFTNQLSVIDYQLPAAILMGGSIVGIAYTLDKSLPLGRSPLLWKIVFIPAGFVAVYSLISFLWLAFFSIAVVLVLILFGFLRRPKYKNKEKDNSRVKELEKKMEEECC